MSVYWLELCVTPITDVFFFFFFNIFVSTYSHVLCKLLHYGQRSKKQQQQNIFQWKVQKLLCPIFFLIFFFYFSFYRQSTIFFWMGRNTKKNNAIGCTFCDILATVDIHVQYCEMHKTIHWLHKKMDLVCIFPSDRMKLWSWIANQKTWSRFSSSQFLHGARC